MWLNCQSATLRPTVKTELSRDFTTWTCDEAAPAAALTRTTASPEANPANTRTYPCCTLCPALRHDHFPLPLKSSLTSDHKLLPPVRPYMLTSTCHHRHFG